MVETEMPEKSSKFDPPDYTIKSVYTAIPEHCLQSHTLLSISYVLRDASFVISLAYIALTQIPSIQTQWIRVLAWTAYSFCQGLIFTGLWELAHECGHGALSEKKWVNDAMGMIIHSFLLVPYHSWRLTHSTHHKTTNNIDRDIAFVPDIKQVYIAKRDSHGYLMKVWDLIQDMPIVALLELIIHQLVAFPTYLLINNFALPRMAAVPWWKRSHFYTGGDGPNFKPKDTKDILLSNVGVALSVSMLYAFAQCFGIWNTVKLYGFPYLWTNHWILTITFLQHNDISLPYYRDKSWTFIRGAASAIDRDFGFVGRHLFHGAIETHVLHHHVSRIPFYHAAEASKALKSVMGQHYKSDFDTPYLWALWKNRRVLRFVEKMNDGREIYFFPKSN